MAEDKKRARWVDVVCVLILLALLAMSFVFSRRTQVGVVNASLVAKELGVEAFLSKEADEFRSKLGLLDKSYQKQFDDLGKRLDTAVSEAEKVEIQKLASELRQTAKQEATGLDRDFQEGRSALAQGFLREIEPIIAEVAKKRRLSLVLNSSLGTGVMFSHECADITQDVLEQARGTISAEDFVSDAASADAPVGK